MNRVTKTQAAYIAGFFDGEGCVSTKSNRNSHPRITLAQKDRGVLDYIVEILGYGEVYKNSRILIDIMRINSKSCQTHFIKLVLPYSVVKRSQLEVALKLLDLVGSGSYLRRSLSLDNRQQRALLAKKLKELKYESH